MTEANTLQIFWFAALSFIFLVFLLLDGFDMGIGMMLPFFSGKDAQKKALLDVAWPFWDGNELWAIIGGACLFAAFPAAFVALIGGLAPFVAVLLACLMFRTVSFEAWYKDPRRRRFWEFVQAIGSLALAFGLGLVAGNLIAGLHLTGAGSIDGSPFAALQPYALLTGLLSAVASLAHGAAYLRKKAEGPVREKATSIARKALAAEAALALAALAWTVAAIPEARTVPLFWVGAAVAAGAAAAFHRSLSGPGDGAPFYLSAASIAGAWTAGSAALFPYLIRPSGSSGGLGLAQAASPDSTLAFLAVFGTVAIAIVLGYTLFVYRVFKGKSALGASTH